MFMDGVLVSPIGTLRTCSSTVFRACFRYDNGGMENPHEKNDFNDFSDFFISHNFSSDFATFSQNTVKHGSKLGSRSSRTLFFTVHFIPYKIDMAI